MRRAFEQRRDKARMQRVPRAIGRQTSEDLLAHQRKISKEVEDLMADELIGITQRRFVEHAALGQHDGVFERSTPHEARCLERFDFIIETERSGGSDERAIVFRGDLDLELLVTDQRMLESDLVFQTERVGRIDRDAFAVLLEDEGFVDPPVSTLSVTTSAPFSESAW